MPFFYFIQNNYKNAEIWKLVDAFDLAKCIPSFT